MKCRREGWSNFIQALLDLYFRSRFHHVLITLIQTYLSIFLFSWWMWGKHQSTCRVQKDAKFVQSITDDKIREACDSSYAMHNQRQGIDLIGQSRWNGCFKHGRVVWRKKKLKINLLNCFKWLFKNNIDLKWLSLKYWISPPQI